MIIALLPQGKVDVKIVDMAVFIPMVKEDIVAAVRQKTVN